MPAAMPKLRTHYDTLHVSRDAPIDVIQSAYRSLARKYHPDRRGGSPESQAAMQALNAAYDVLKNPLTRAEHDRWIESKLGAEPPVAPPPGFESADPLEPFLDRDQPPGEAESNSTTRAALSALLSIGYVVVTLTLIATPRARFAGLLLLIGGWFYYINHSRRRR